jgi:SAM-dependent methyltransferase
MTWSDGYFTDLNYSHGYYSEMNPAMLRLACLCQAIEPQLPENPDYLELGFGQGVSINIHAAGSEGSYWGTDFNPAQTVEARKLATASGADLRLLDDSFEELAARTDLPDFDVIALHGIWSWISQKNRRLIADIIRRKLRPGGIAYISYNCMPGWAPIIPMRQMLTLYQEYGGGKMLGPAATIDGALQFLAEIAKSGSNYFQDNPFARHHLEQLLTQRRNYVAHEYMNADWHIQHFSDMVRDLGDTKLTFVGSARLLDGIDNLQLSDDGQKVLSKIGHPIMRETVRDHLVNRRFRTDIFVKGPRRLPDREHREAWHSQSFVMTAPPSDIPKKITCSRGDAELPAARYDPVIWALFDDFYKPKRIDELLRHSESSKLTPQEIVEVLTVLCGAGFVCPAKEPSAIVKKQCRALNDCILQKALTSTDLHHMVSPLTGGGIALTHMNQLFIQATNEGKVGPDALAAYVWQFLESIGERLMKDGERLESAEENIHEITISAKRFINTGQPLLEALQIMEKR